MRVGLLNPMVPRVIDVPVALEDDVAALDLGGAEQLRGVVGALEPEVRAGDHAHEVVLHAEAARGVDGDVEAQRDRARRRRRGRPAARSAAGEAEERVRIEPARVERVVHGDGPGEQRRADVAAKRQVGIDRRRESLGIAEVHVGAPGRQRQLPGREPGDADPAAELHVAAAELCREIVDADPRGIERHPSVDRLERVRHQHVTDAPVHDRGASGKHRLGDRPVHLRLEPRGPRTADIPEEPREDAEVGVALRP